MSENGDFRKRCPHWRFSKTLFTCGRVKTEVFENDDVIIGSIATWVCRWLLYVFKMADQKCMATSLTLISSIIACIQLHVSMLNVHREYMRKQMNVMKMLSISMLQKIVLKHLKKKPARP